MSSLNLAAEFHRAGILRDHFKQVPEDYLALPGDDARRGDVRIRCICGTETDLRRGQLASCDCGRTFWNGAKVYAAPPAAPDDHVCEPARVTIKGATLLADYCAICKADIG